MRSSINVTPLVDVCLVLLIIFMVVTDKLGPGKDVPLPRTANHVVTAAKPRVVSLTRDGAGVRIWWDREPLGGPADLEARLAAEPRSIFAPVVVVKADAGLSYGEVYAVLAALHRSGATGAALATREL
jgi:biopolymer transport protein ExbD